MLQAIQPPRGSELLRPMAGVPARGAQAQLHLGRPVPGAAQPPEPGRDPPNDLSLALVSGDNGDAEGADSFVAGNPSG